MVKKKPFFSIVIPTCNRALDLKFVIYCILRQNFRDFEVIVADDYSIDNTGDIVSGFKDKRLRYFRNKKNVGLVVNIGKAIILAKGKYVFIHGDDDFLLYCNSLRQIYEKIKQLDVGYLRVNYLCITPDKKSIFDFNINKSFKKDKYLPAFSKNKDILSFILGSDPYFMTGIIFKNEIPENIKIINSELIPWILILFYVASNFGSYVIAKPCVIASWSKKKVEKDNHPRAYYSLVNGKILSENLYTKIQKKVDRKEYKKFLHDQLMRSYVIVFPAIKHVIGNKEFLRLAKRIYVLDPEMKKAFSYWAYLVLSLLLPRFLLGIIRDVYYAGMYRRFSKTGNYELILNKVMKLNQEYSNNKCK